MTWKTWIFSFTTVCFLNTIFCFHTADIFRNDSGQPSVEETDSYAGSGTLLDFLLQQLQDDGSDPDGKTPLKLKCRHNHFVSRFLSLSIQAPQTPVLSALFTPEQTPTEYGNYQVRKACLPSYYNFLFRLNLF